MIRWIDALLHRRAQRRWQQLVRTRELFAKAVVGALAERGAMAPEELAAWSAACGFRWSRATLAREVALLALRARVAYRAGEYRIVQETDPRKTQDIGLFGRMMLESDSREAAMGILAMRRPKLLYAEGRGLRPFTPAPPAAPRWVAPATEERG